MFNSDGSLSFSTNRTNTSGIRLVDCQTYLSNATTSYQEKVENDYGKTLKNYLKEDSRAVREKYESIQNYIQSVLKSHMNEHNFTLDKLKELCR